MELLKQLLSADNITIADLETELTALGYDPTTLTDSEAMEAASKLKAKYSKTLAKSTKKSTAKVQQTKPVPSDNIDRNTRTDRTPSVNNGLGQSLGHAVNQSVQEVTILQTGIKAAKDKIVTTKANEMLDEIADIPNATLQKFSELAAQHASNPTFFQQRTEEVTASILTAFGITEA